MKKNLITTVLPVTALVGVLAISFAQGKKVKEDNLAKMNAAYGAGQVSLNELFRSQEQRVKIQSAHLTMVHDYRQALVEWEAATARNIIIQ